MKKLTVVTSTYNRGSYNIPSIQSILSQTYQNFQYLLVNDGSTDETAQILDAMRHPNLTVIHQRNKGFTNTLIDVMQKVDTPYVALQDAGDISHPERLEKQMKLLESDSSVAAVGCLVRAMTSDGQWSELVEAPPIDLSDPIQGQWEKNYFTHGEVMFRLSCYKKVGGYRRFFQFAQDRDLWLRMASVGKLARLDEILYTRILFPDSISCDYSRKELQALLSVFAVHLARQRLEGRPDDLETMGEAAFTKFQRSLTQEAKDDVSKRILQSSIRNYFQTGHPELLVSAARRALEWSPDNDVARLYLKFATLVESGNEKVFELVKSVIHLRGRIYGILHRGTLKSLIRIIDPQFYKKYKADLED